MNDEMTSLERIDIIKGMLDKLVDAQGRAKCGYITVIDDFLNKIRDDILIKEEMLKDKNDIKIEPIGAFEELPESAPQN